MIGKEVHKNYRRASVGDEEEMNSKGMVIATKLEIEDRVFAIQKRPAVISVKDQKESFPNSIETRLINPTIAELGRVAMQKLAKVVSKIIDCTHLTQWKNNLAVIDWFNSLEHKKDVHFIELDIVSFYPSIYLQKAVHPRSGLGRHNGRDHRG